MYLYKFHSIVVQFIFSLSMSVRFICGLLSFDAPVNKCKTGEGMACYHIPLELGLGLLCGSILFKPLIEV